MIPVQLLRLHERLQQPFLGDPIDSADECLLVLLECFKNEAPVFQQPVCFGALVPQILLRQLMEFPLHVECADGFAVFKIDNPSLSEIARNIAGALHGIG